MPRPVRDLLTDPSQPACIPPHRASRRSVPERCGASLGGRAGGQTGPKAFCPGRRPGGRPAIVAMVRAGIDPGQARPGQADWPIVVPPERGGVQAPFTSGFGPAGRDGRISATAIWPSGCPSITTGTDCPSGYTTRDP